MGKDTQYNAQRLLWAGFMAILAAGVGFSIRGGILADWGSQFGFTKGQLGAITGGGLTGFGIIILIGSFLADRLGYGRLMIGAFIAHLLSAVLTLAATPLYGMFADSAPETAKFLAYQCLFWGMFLFAIGNGIAEAVVNPLVATLFPENKTHYLNILHAGWPGGLIVGGMLSLFMVGNIRWEIQIAMFLIPTVIYGLMLIGQNFPKSEAGEKGVEYTEMLKELGLLGAAVICVLLTLFFASDILPIFISDGGAVTWIIAGAIGIALLGLFGSVTKFTLGPPMLAFLLVIHAMVGYVELGTDSWISNITGIILANRSYGLALFVYTSALMFALRFFAGPIVHRISPLGLLLVSAIAGAIGLVLLGSAQGAIFCVLAATVYGFGKTYFWPTMLGVVSERFPKGGAITIGSIGGVGMLSAGLLGTPGIGYKQDFYAQKTLQEESVEAYDEFKTSDTPRKFLFLPEVYGLDPFKVEVVKAKNGMIGGNAVLISRLTGDVPEDFDDTQKEEAGKPLDDEAREELVTLAEGWWEFTEDEKDALKEKQDNPSDDNPLTYKETIEVERRDIIANLNEGEDLSAEQLSWFSISSNEEKLLVADEQGGRSALKLTAIVPAIMAVCYLLLFLYFAKQGGYRQVSLDEDE